LSEARQFETIDARQLESLRVFHEVARALTSNLDLDAVLRTILSKMEEFFGPEQWSLLIVDEEAQELYYALVAGASDDSWQNTRIPINHGIAGRVAASGQPLVIADIGANKEWARYAAEHPELNLQSIASLPIRHGKRTLGVLQLHNSKLNLLPDSSMAFLRVLCDYAAIALHNAEQVKLIHDLSITDDCTGLFNARYLYSSIEQEIEAASNPRVRPIQPQFSLLFMDLDHFKSINDTHGHLAGSRLLAEVGSLIKRILGPQHVGFRYGGDEFVALLRGLDKAAATALAIWLRKQLNEMRFLTAQGLALTMNASLGLATYPEDGDNLHAIIRSADTMMYQAKAEGRDRIAVANPQAPAVFPTLKTSRHS
jgi:diguanylate cyclase (GGDEF)-like protein